MPISMSRRRCVVHAVLTALATALLGFALGLLLFQIKQRCPGGVPPSR
jgi:hypothetical protein